MNDTRREKLAITDTMNYVLSHRQNETIRDLDRDNETRMKSLAGCFLDSLIASVGNSSSMVLFEKSLSSIMELTFPVAKDFKNRHSIDIF